MELSIIIPVYNTIEYLSRCVESVIKNIGIDKEIILVDDGNGQETKSCLEQISSTYPDFVKLVVLEKNSGKGGAVKAGVKYAYENGIINM